MIRNRAPSRQTRDVLAVLIARPLQWRHGYELSKLAGLSSGTLYPLLIRLHERGLLEAQWMEPERPGRPPRHAYRLSSAGLAYTRGFEPNAESAGAPEGSEVRA